MTEYFDQPDHIAAAEEYGKKWADMVTYPVDTRGHNLYRKWDHKEISDRIASHFRFHCHTLEEMQEMHDRSVKEGHFSQTDARSKCYHCGEETYGLNIYTDGKVKMWNWNLKNRKDHKKYEWEICSCQELKPVVVEIDIPSGKMLVANHFHVLEECDLYKLPEFEDKQYTEPWSINHLAGQRRTMEAYAKHTNHCNLNIGNCACDMYRMKDDPNHFVVGGMLHDVEDYLEEDEDIEPAAATIAEQVADVCTDYWGYCVIDWTEDRVKRLEEREPFSQSYDIVECQPGRYRFTHMYHMEGHNELGEIYTEIVRVGECNQSKT